MFASRKSIGADLFEKTAQANPVLGFRCWEMPDIPLSLEKHYYEHHQGLGSTYIKGSSWNKGVNKAVCDSTMKCKRCPGRICDCGLNAFHFPSERLADIAYRDTGSNMVWGVVAGAGKTRLHRGGWRTEESQILAFYSPTFLGERHCLRIQSAADHYDVPTFEYFSDLLKFVNELGFDPDCFGKREAYVSAAMATQFGIQRPKELEEAYPKIRDLETVRARRMLLNIKLMKIFFCVSLFSLVMAFLGLSIFAIPLIIGGFGTITCMCLASHFTGI